MEEMKKPYSDTINLPKTPFSMQANLLERQGTFVSRWQAQDLYRSLLEEKRDAEPFTIHDGPPYASGQMHVGIGFNKVIKDIVAKFQSMSGRKVVLVPGWDCHGLPIEKEVVSELGEGASQLSRQEIRTLCEEHALRYVARQRREFELLGGMADWSRPYLTIDPAYEAGVLSVLLDVIEKGYIFRATRPLAWCPSCDIGLADSEVEALPSGRPDAETKGSCLRCGTEVEIRDTEQWFVRLDHVEPGQAKNLRERALIEIEVTEWKPAGSKARIRSMLETRGDWCISRQRSWGVPLPAVVCQGCGKAHLDTEVVRRVRDRVAEEGSQAWFERPLEDFLPGGLACPTCGATSFLAGSDVLDVWFESGASFQSVLVADYRGRFPADLCIEGHDQHRGWFQLSLLLALIVRGKAPFKSVLTHGFVLNEQGLRMNRTRGDLVTLGEALESYPADLLRLYFASVDSSSDVPFSLRYVGSVETTYRTLRNTFRFLLGNLTDYQPREHSVHLADLHPFDHWVLCRLYHLVQAVTSSYESYKFHDVTRQLHDFANDTLSKSYLDFVKDRLYCEAPNSRLRRSAQTVLHSILTALVKQVAPILPFTAEEVWDLTPGHGDCASVHLSRWPKPDEELLHRGAGLDAVATVERFLALKRVVDPALEALRGDGKLGRSTDALVELNLQDSPSYLGTLKLEDLRSLLRVGQVRLLSSDEGQSIEDLPGVLSFGVAASDHRECPRCQQRDETCGQDLENPDLCLRCATVLTQLALPPKRKMPSLHSIEPSARPADVAAFLRSRGIRKAAILNEDGFCRVWALHPSSREVRELVELKPLADYVNQSPDFREHAAILLGLGEHTDVLFGIGIHRLNYGTPLGGTREYAYGRISDLIDNLLRLSWGMSVKNAVAELPHAGGKSIIDPCGHDLKTLREFRRAIYRDFGQFTASLFGRYICAEDVGNTTADTRDMLSACRHTMCLPEGVGGSGNPSRFTALAAWAAMKGGWKFLTGSSSFEGLTIALQGAGNVGRNFVNILSEVDRGFGRLLIADRDPEAIQNIRNILLKKDLGDRLEVMSSKDPESLGDSYVEREDETGKPYILFAPCDILIPAAIGKVLDPKKAERLACRLIAPIANNVYSDNDLVAEVLHSRGIVDVVENNINWGGAMAAASELRGYDQSNIALACLEAHAKTISMLGEAKSRNLPAWVVIKERALERIFKGAHPTVAAAREYRFIGDFSQNFPEWVKESWLNPSMETDELHIDSGVQLD